MTVTTVSNIPIAIDYTGRDYYAIREALIARIQERIPEWTASDPADFGVALVEAFSYMGDLISYYIDRAANEAFLETAVQRQSLLNMAQSYGYVPAGYRQALVTLTFSNTSESNVTIPTGTVVSGELKIEDTVQTIYFTTISEIIVAANNTEDVTATEGRSIQRISDDTNTFGELVGTSTQQPDMRFSLSQTNVVDTSLTVYVQDGDIYSKWTKVQHLLDYSPIDLVYTTVTDEDGNVSIQFGDGISGAIPTLYSEIRAEYTVGTGTLGNVPADTISAIEYIPGLSEVQIDAIQAAVTVSNAGVAVGGADPETNDQIREAAPAAIRSGNRAVTLKDFEDLALTVSGVGKAKASSTVWTSVNLYISPSRSPLDNDEAPGLDSNGDETQEFLTLKSNIESYLSDKTLIGTSVSVLAPTYVEVAVSMDYVRLPQYTAAEVEANIINAMALGFNYTEIDFADTIYPQDIEFVVQQAPGIKTVKVTELYRVGELADLTTLQGTADEIFRFPELSITLTEA